MTYFLPIQGTHGWNGTPKLRWWMPTSPLNAFFAQEGLQLIAAGEDPFVWTTNLDGLPWRSERKHVAWHAAGINLRRYCKPGPPGTPEGAHYVPYEHRNFIAHSHGLQVVLYAAARGLRVHRLVSVSSPVRNDMMEIAEQARPNIAEWLHVASDRSDIIQWLGELFDGRLGIVRDHPLADENVRIRAVGHSRLLEDAEAFPEWKTPRPLKSGDRGVIDWFTRAGDPPAAA